MINVSCLTVVSRDLCAGKSLLTRRITPHFPADDQGKQNRIIRRLSTGDGAAYGAGGPWVHRRLVTHAIDVKARDGKRIGSRKYNGQRGVLRGGFRRAGRKRERGPWTTASASLRHRASGQLA